MDENAEPKGEEVLDPRIDGELVIGDVYEIADPPGILRGELLQINCQETDQRCHLFFNNIPHQEEFSIIHIIYWYRTNKFQIWDGQGYDVRLFKSSTSEYEPGMMKGGKRHKTKRTRRVRHRKTKSRRQRRRRRI